MCDDAALDDMLDYDLRSGVSRRRFGALALGAGAATFWSPAKAAVPVQGRDVEIATPDGVADAWFVHPTTGAHAAVLVWPDIFGLRPAFRQMGQRLAESGYAVLTVNPFYRKQKAPTAPAGADLQDPAVRAALMALRSTLTPASAATDANAFVTWLDAQPAVDRKRRIGTTGYCMGGPLTMQTAAARPDRVGAGASFHGGGLATDKPDSPHRLIPKMKAQFLIAIAENDHEREPAAKDLLREAFAAANLPAEIEVYAGAQHGWCPPDSRVYDEAQAERAWGRLLALLERAIA